MGDAQPDWNSNTAEMHSDHNLADIKASIGVDTKHCYRINETFPCRRSQRTAGLWLRNNANNLVAISFGN